MGSHNKYWASKNEKRTVLIRIIISDKNIKQVQLAVTILVTTKRPTVRGQ